MAIHTIGEICSINALSIKKGEHPKQILYLDTANLVEGRVCKMQEMNFTDAPSRAQRRINNNTILYSSVRPNLKHFGIMTNMPSNVIVSTGFITFDVIDKSLFSPYYIYYLLTQQSIIDYLQGIAQTGVSAYPSINPSDIANLKFNFPSLSEQEQIASVLSNIDRKITLNRQINDNLEAVAKQLYDYWFVQFDFPDENGKPYKSSGGKMVWNECMKKSIPADWKTSQLSEWIDYSIERVHTSVVSDGDFYTPIEVIPRKKMSLSTISPLENAVSGLCRYKKKDILLSNRRVYFHKICLAPFDGLTRDTVMVLRPKHEEDLGYIYETMFSDSFISYATKVSYGSLQPVLSWTEAQKYHVLTPANNLSEKYSKLINGIIEKVLSSQMEIIQLTKQRDELLPLLMDGQATVNYHFSAYLFI